MKTKSIYFIALFFIAFSISAEAQINLKKLGKQVKRSAEQQVEQKIKEKSARETRNALDRGEKKFDEGVSNVVSGGDANNKETKATVTETNEVSEIKDSNSSNARQSSSVKSMQKVSAEALAADPMASDETIESGFTKSISEIHAAYEQLDPEVFTYQPYYEYKELYFLHDKANEDWREREFNAIIAKLANQYPGDSYNMDYVRITTPDGNLLVTSDEFFRNAWTALFVADPMSSIAFDKFTKALMFGNQMFEAKIYYDMDDPYKGIVNEKKGELLIAPTRLIYENRQDSREEAGLNLARNVVSIDFLRTYLKNLLKQASDETDAVKKYKLYWQIDPVMNKIFRKHKEYNSADVANRQIEATFSALDSQRFDIEANARLSNAKSVEIPKGVQIDAATSSKINSLAKEMLGDEFVKAIYLDNKWSEFQENKYPYRVMHLSLPVAVIVKRGDKYLMNHYDITKSPNGGSWNMMVKMGSTFQPVNYK